MKKGRFIEILSHIRGSISVLVISVFVEVIAGSILGQIFYHSYFPGILILIPPMMELRDNISSVFAAKLSTALHPGTVKPQFTKNTQNFKSDFYSSLIIILVMPIILGLLVWIFCLIFNISNMGLLFFISISLLTGVISGLMMAAI